MKEFKFCLPVKAKEIVTVKAETKENALMLLCEGVSDDVCYTDTQVLEIPTLDHLVSEVELEE